MSLLLNKTFEIFPVDGETLIIEKITNFKISFNISDIPSLDYSTLEEYLSIISIYDTFALTIRLEENAPISISSKNDINQFLKNYEDEIRYFEPEETLKFKLEIEKVFSNNSLSVYSRKHFEIFWGQIEVINLLKVLSNFFNQSRTIHFKFIEENTTSFYTSNIYFSNNLPTVNHSTNRILNEEIHFGNYQEYPYSPNFFHLLHRPKTDNEITKKLDILKSLFSIISIFDISIIKENNFYYKLNGYRTYEGTISINNNFIKCTDIYYSIFDWVYSNKGNLSDKLGLARNVISIYLNSDILDINSNVLLSIKSAYKTYLKENVDRYIQIRTKIFNELSWISQRSSEVIEKYLGNYQKSILTYVSFFISVFVLRILNTGNFINVFSKDATILSLAFLIISSLFLFFSYWNLCKEKDRLKRKYNNIKMRYKDLLIDDDINKILENDSEFNYEISFINDRLKIYTILWISTLIILLATVLTISNYINWWIIF